MKVNVALSAIIGFAILGICFASRAQTISLEPIKTGLDLPIGITHAQDGSGRLFINLQRGKLVIWDGSKILATPFLDVSSLVSCCGERGLLGVAFHPQYGTNGYSSSITPIATATRSSRVIKCPQPIPTGLIPIQGW